jgi:hypothetical protein
MNMAKGRQRRWLGALMLAAVAISVLWIAFCLPKEPAYQGVGLSEWLDRMEKARAGDVAKVEAENAIRAIGTNGIPYLLHLITRKDPWRYRLSHYLNTHWDGRFAYEIGYGGRTPDRWRALQGFTVISTNAVTAIPALRQMATNSDADLSQAAVMALAEIGRDGQLAMVGLLSDSNFHANGGRSVFFGALHGKKMIPEIVPVTLSASTNWNYPERLWAITAFDRIDGYMSEKAFALDTALTATNPISPPLSTTHAQIFSLEVIAREPSLMNWIKFPVWSLTNSPNVALRQYSTRIMTNRAASAKSAR